MKLFRNRTILTALFLTLINLTAYGFYDPSLQRWITRDPIEEKGGINLYTFTDNDPVSEIDPNGLLPIDEPEGYFCPRLCPCDVHCELTRVRFGSSKWGYGYNTYIYSCTDCKGNITEDTRTQRYRNPIGPIPGSGSPPPPSEYDKVIYIACPK
jgi:uncharacterized protein RhaS with RHS repeats